MKGLDKAALATLFTIFTLSAFCARITDSSNDNGLSELERLLEQTPRADKEAELAALWLSDELVAPESLYQEIRDGLSIIRSEYEYWESFYAYGMYFKYNLVESEICVQFAHSVISQIRQGSYTGWDSLNALYRVTIIDTSEIGFSFSGGAYVVLNFEGRLNPIILSQYYSELESVIWAEHSSYGGDWSNVYPWIVDS